MEKAPAKRHPREDTRAFRSALIKWFQANGKPHPWRQTRDPWAVLVSEIMLQQTTVVSVLANRRFENFLEEFPDLQAMADASEEQILRAWEGLGYYNRVRNLQKTACAVLARFNGEFPSDPATLESLPGIGRYTAGAVSSFAFDQATPIVDGNIARVLSRLFDFREAIDSTPGQAFSWENATRLLDPSQPRLFNSALMELGQTLCTPKKPACLLCPVRDFCQSRDPETLPVKKPRRGFVSVEEHALLWVRKGEILLSPGHDNRRRGFWKLPLRSAEACAHLKADSIHRYVITHHKVTLLLYRHQPQQLLPGERYHRLDQLDQLPVATPIRKILTQLQGSLEQPEG